MELNVLWEINLKSGEKRVILSGTFKEVLDKRRSMDNNNKDVAYCIRKENEPI